MTHRILGIDYGSKLAGTTAICFTDGSGSIIQQQSSKGQDADRWLWEVFDQLKPNYTGIDAPLSLPLVYQGHELDTPNYFYRNADRELQAMSPMFLGGLTARAMKLNRWLSDQNGLTMLEVYPKAHAQRLDLIQYGYKKGSRPQHYIFEEFCRQSGFSGKMPDNWHGFDALLGWHIIKQLLEGRAEMTGQPDEGLIFY